MAWSIVTPPSLPAVSLTEARDHLRVTGTEENTLIERLVDAAAQYVETVCNRALMPQTWAMQRDGFPGSVIPLTGGPFRSVEIEYLDAAGDSQTLDPADYYALLAEPARLFPVGNWPQTNGAPGSVTTTAEVGYEGGAPEPLRQAVLLLVGHWFANRSAAMTGGASSEMPLAVSALLFPFRDGSII